MYHLAPVGRNFVLAPVSRYFRLDWNVALRIVRVPTFKWASQLIISTPIIAQFTPLLQFRETQVWMLWASSAAFLAGFAILKSRCPQFLQEYKNYKEYDDCGHAHRWILWRFYHDRGAIANHEDLIRETIMKGISFPAYLSTANGSYDVCPIFPLEAVPLRLHQPRNFNNDLYLPFILDGERYVLPMQEADPSIKRNEKELFWIFFSACAKTRPVARFFVWSLFLLSALLFCGALAVILYLIATSI